MKYMVLECHPGYAVVLDEDGNFLKVANLRYEVGQMVTDVVPMRSAPRRKYGKWLTSFVAAAACLALVLGITLPGRPQQQPYASVFVKINPEVRIDVDQQDMVVGVEGVNQDGIDLVQGYAYQNKHLDLVTDELVDKAIDMGYLQPDGEITLSLASPDQVWVDQHTQTLTQQLQTHLQERIVVTIQVQICYGDHDEGHHNWQHPGPSDNEIGIYISPENPNRVEIVPSFATEAHHEHDHHDDDDDDDDWDDDDDDWDDDDDEDDD